MGFNESGNIRTGRRPGSVDCIPLKVCFSSHPAGRALRVAWPPGAGCVTSICAIVSLDVAPAFCCKQAGRIEEHHRRNERKVLVVHIESGALRRTGVHPGLFNLEAPRRAGIPAVKKIERAARFLHSRIDPGYPGYWPREGARGTWIRPAVSLEHFLVLRRILW